MSELNHLDAAGHAHMVDVGAKDATRREAIARGVIQMRPDTLRLIVEGGLPKGDVLAVARIAGIMAAKRTPDLVPLCHPIAVHGVTVDLTVDDDGVAVTATVRTADRTGVEMEALTSVTVACLTVVDMTKSVDPRSVIRAVQVESKTGGKTGEWQR
jgi:cyclic pyranopterin phosphate synthase